MTISLRSIKSDNVRAVFGCIAGENKTSRAEITAKTGLSLVTVGKITDALIEADAVREEKKISSSAGRRAGLLSLNAEKFAVVADLSGGKASVVFYTVSMDPIKHIEFRDNNFEDMLAETAMTILNDYGADNCIGISVLVDECNRQDTVEKTVRTFFPDKRVTVSLPITAAVLSTVTYIDEGGISLYLSVTDESLVGAFVMNLKPYPKLSARITDFGSMSFFDGSTLIGKLKSAEGEEYSDYLAMCVYNTSRISYPDAVVVDIENRKDRKATVGKIKKYVEKRCAEIGENAPKIICAETDPRLSHRGLIVKLREMWLDDILSGENKKGE